MKINVCTVTYNQLKSLTKLYSSLVAQKEYLNEWVVRDDGSTDGSIEQIRAWQQEAIIPIKFVGWIHDGNYVVCKMNECIKALDEKPFIMCFGDTYLADDTLKTITDSYIGGSYGASYRVNVKPSGEVISGDYRLEEGANDVREMMTTKMAWQAFPGNGMIATKKMMAEIGYIDEVYGGYGIDDYDTAMRIMMNGNKMYLYNNVKIYHVDHANKEATKDNIEHYFRKLKGDNCRFGGKEITLSIGGITRDNLDFYFLDALHEALPNFKATLFTDGTKDTTRGGWLEYLEESQFEISRLPQTGEKTHYLYSHRLDEPFWFCLKGAIRLHGDMTTPFHLSNLLKISPTVKWRFVSEVL